MQAQGLRVLGWGHYAPARVVTNDDLSLLIDTTDEWIYTRTGIRRRHIADEHETSGSMAVEAARKALTVAGLTGGDIDLTIVTTTTPDYVLPATASLVQSAIGAHGGAFDLEAGCTGFIYALAQAWGAIATGLARHVLIAGSEVFSRLIDWTDRTTCVLFGDGAGAVVVGASADATFKPHFALHSDGGGADALVVPAGGGKRPASVATVAERAHYLRMEGTDVFRFSRRIIPEVVDEVLRAAGASVDDIALFVPHQANKRILTAAAHRLCMPMDRVMLNVEEYGNTAAASIPMALAEAASGGRLGPGDRLLLAGYGSGLAWGGALLRWG